MTCTKITTVEYANERKESLIFNYTYRSREKGPYITVHKEVEDAYNKIYGKKDGILYYCYYACTCGAIIKEYSINLLDMSLRFSDVGEKRHCKICNKVSIPMRIFSEKDHRMKGVHSNVIEKEDKIVLQDIKLGYRFLFNQNRHIGKVRNQYITFNKKTKNFYYLCKNSDRKTISTFRCINLGAKGIHYSFNGDILIKFIRLCLQHENQTDLLRNYKDFSSIILRVKYKSLSSFEKDVNGIIKELTPYQRQKLAKNRNIKETIKIIFGRKEKSFIKLVAKAESYETLYFWSKLFTDINCLTRLYSFGARGLLVHNGIYDKEGVNKAIEFKKRLGSEVKFLNMIFNSKIKLGMELKHTMNDSINMSDQIEKLGGIVPDFRKYKSINKLHDELVLIYNRQTSKNIEFDVENDKYLNGKVEDFEFKVAECSHELSDIGTLMHICVGSYKNKVLNRDCRIVSVTKDNSYVICLELKLHSDSRELYELVQAKGQRNSRLDKHSKSSVISWCNINNIRWTECHDVNGRFSDDLEEVEINHPDV